MALALAAELDGFTKATAKSNCANALREVLAQIRDLVPVDLEGDELDELSSRRSQRLEGHPTAARGVLAG